MNKLPTAEELFKELFEKSDCYIDFDKAGLEVIKKSIIEFAKLHVKAAIETCIEEAPSGSSTDTVSYEDVVKALKDCYPESNIK